MTDTIRYALVRPLPKSFADALQQHAPLEPIVVEKAHAQHERYTELLKKLVGKVIVVAVDEQYPDCCFIEDTAIVVGHDVIISRIGAMSRRNESVAVLRAFQELQKLEPKLKIHRLLAPATLDGGDVLQMNGKVFVGLSQRTNQAAVDQLQDILPGVVVSIPVVAGLHLKSVLSALDAHTLLAAEHPAAKQMAEQILAALPPSLQNRCLEVPDAAASNVVRVGSTLLIQAGFPNSEAILAKAASLRGWQIETLDMSELIKADGALSCCSILI